MKKIIDLFHRDIMTLRSHHWKYFMNTYEGCSYCCAYCLNAYTVDFYKKIKIDISVIREIEEKLKNLDKRIVFFGSNTDPYIKEEAETKTTREILKLFFKYEIPITILTKSTNIERDIDILKELSKKNLVLAQITITTTDEKSKKIELNVPSTEKRLQTIKRLTENGIPVHVHFSPVIPYLNTDAEINYLIKRIKDAGATCVYSNILGIHSHQNKFLFNALSNINDEITQKLKNIYELNVKKEDYIHSPYGDYILTQMEPIKKACMTNKIGYVNEMFPEETNVSFADFNSNLFFKYSFPTIYDMISYFKLKDDEVTFEVFKNEFLKNYLDFVKDKEYLDYIKELWDSGELFELTKIRKKKNNLYYRDESFKIEFNNYTKWNT